MRRLSEFWKHHYSHVVPRLPYWIIGCGANSRPIRQENTVPFFQSYFALIQYSLRHFIILLNIRYNCIIHWYFYWFACSSVQSYSGRDNTCQMKRETSHPYGGCLRFWWTCSSLCRIHNAWWSWNRQLEGCNGMVVPPSCFFIDLLIF